MEWWQKAIIYQIYPRSFNDTTGNGIGDLQGIISKLDYIQSLNCDAIWLCPIYPSPQKDFGYDVSDYQGINPEYGTMDDFDQLIKMMHSRDMKLIMDFVPNHTSDQHPWFLEASKSKDNPYRDYYIWKDPKPGSSPPEPPNNWEGQFGGPAWSYHEATGQYYLHQFVREQPELNYENPQVMVEMKENMRFWFDHDVDGLRLDTAPLYKKDQSYQDDTIRENWDENAGKPAWKKWHFKPLIDVNGVHDIIAEFRSVADEYPKKMLMGEIYLEFERLMTYYGEHGDLFQFPTNMTLVNEPFDLEVIKPLIIEYYQWFSKEPYTAAWPNWQFSNHDRLRMASRIPHNLRLAFLMLFTLKGTPITYYGDEIGMLNGDIPSGQVKDPFATLSGDAGIIHNRDRCRTPMQWTDDDYAGFSTANPWLPISPKYQEQNVKLMESDSTSLLNYFRELTKLRQTTPALYLGEIAFVPVPADNINQLFIYSRTDDRSTYFILLNFGNSPLELDLQALLGLNNFELILSTIEMPTFTKEFHLPAHQGIILK